MAIKKSELYSSLWQSCDELRGGMDASQYKDYVLVMLFIKYISDKYAGVAYAPITIPKGASFKDMVALKGKSSIGDDINKKIIGPLANANKLSDFPDFNDPTKLGDGKEKVDRLTNLIAIFENKALNFSKNGADGDDILGDAYEYLMRHFATESGKSKGQFYTPSEVSRIMAQIIGIGEAKTSAATTVSDPTCGSGSLLLKVGDEAGTPVTLYGQEKDAATSGLARMNMILHNNPTALIKQGNTLTDPKFKDGDTLKTFDFVVANPPFSDKRWSTGLDPAGDPYERFKPFGTPPAKQGDYAYLLHIVRTLKSKGKGACILPHGVLFRGNAEGDIRRALVRKGYIKGIIGLPANLFYGTGIPACIVVIDKENAAARKGIFMIDARIGFMKDGPKNRLRDQDIHKIVDVFNKRLEIPKYSRMVSFEEIERNEFNLNLPRYIDSQMPEDVQDIAGHLQGGIPAADIEALSRYWDVCPNLRVKLFKKNRKGYFDLAVEKPCIKPAIYEHPEFSAFIEGMNIHFNKWRKKSAASLMDLKAGCHPKRVIADLAENLLAHYLGKPLIDPYDIYQHLMDYWAQTMQDDCYIIAADGWKATTYRVIETKKGKDGKPGKEVDKGWACDLIPKPIIVARYFAKEQEVVDRFVEELERVTSQLNDMEEEHSGENGVFSDFDKVTFTSVRVRLKELSQTGGELSQDEREVLLQYLELCVKEAELKKCLKDAEADLDTKAYAHYPKLTKAEIKTLVVEDKWLSVLNTVIYGAMERVSQIMTQRVKELTERYETPLPQLNKRVNALETKVNRNLEKMGFSAQDLLTGKKRLPEFDRKQGYKQTEIGIFPADWDIVPLKNISSMHGRIGWQGLKQSEFTMNPDDPFLITGMNFKDGEIRWDEVYHISNERYEIAKEIQLKIGDVLMTKDGTIGKILYVDHIPHPGKASLNSHLLVFRPLNKKYVPKFLFYQLNSRTFLNHIELEKSGTTFYGITQEAVGKYNAFLPSIPEQTAIAEILSDMDIEIATLEDKLVKARQVKHGMMQELLAGRTRI